MEIKFLKAGSGDCILVQNEDKNILIDGGNDSTYLIEEYNKIISKDEQIDLLVITHHDDDHIKGILDLFKYIKKIEEKPKIRKILFNSPRKILKLQQYENPTNFLSYKQAFDLENILLEQSEIIWISSMEHDSIENLTQEFGALKLKIFSPSQDTLKKYSSDRGAYLTSDYRCDWNTSLKELSKYIDDKSQDSSLSNETSIVILIEYNNTKVLLAADVTPNRFENIIDQIIEDKDIVTFNLIKLPHHGSYRSINSSILDKIKCEKYVISTNGNKHYLPNKRTLLKIIKNRKNDNSIEFFFNYPEVISKLNISNSEMLEYKIKLTHKNSWNYGVDI